MLNIVFNMKRTIKCVRVLLTALSLLKLYNVGDVHGALVE